MTKHQKIEIRISDEDKIAIQAAAEARGETVSQWIRAEALRAVRHRPNKAEALQDMCKVLADFGIRPVVSGGRISLSVKDIKVLIEVATGAASRAFRP